MVSPLPSSAQPIGYTQAGQPVNINQVWQRFFNSFLSAASPSGAVSLTGSPMTIMAAGPGHVLVTGGTVSSITLTRAQTTLATGIIAGFIPVANGDIVAVTYSVAPTITFVPA